MRLRALLFLFFGLSMFGGVAQDSTQTGVHKAHQIRTLNTQYRTIDSTLRPLEYEKFNEFNANRIHYYDNGNMASKGHYKAWNLNTPADLLKGFGDFGYQSVFRNKYEVPLLNVKSPLAELHYSNVYRQGSHFGGYFSQNINPQFNYYLGYARTHSQGRYLRQETNYDNFDWSMQYRSPNNKYKAVFILIWQKTKNEENGGLALPEQFENNEENRRELLTVHLQNSLGTSQKTQVVYNHQYMLAATDSTQLNGLAIYHKLGFNDKYHQFTSTDTLWENYYFSNEANDNTRGKNLFNEAGLKWDINSQYIQSVNAGLFYNIHNYKSTYASRSGSEAGISAELDGNGGDHLIWGAKGSYLLGDKSAAALSVDLDYRFVHSQIGGFALYNSLQPTYFEETYYSNNFIWNNVFDKNKNKTEFGVNYSYRDWFKVEGGYTLLSSWIVMNRQAVPVQLKDDISMFNANAYVRFFAQKPVKIDAYFAYNNMLTGSDNLRLAPFSVESKLFYDFQSFKSALFGQIGLRLKYYSAYNSNAYSPSNAIYYLQDDAMIGNFFYLNAYAIFKIKTLRLFVALENILEGFIPYDYYSTPYYPLNDRVFRIGMKWRFFN
ncbi:MAG: putative porin [Schleiferiaceae bacterium]|nr:putative porin [Schleiferiaceae bacterium]